MFGTESPCHGYYTQRYCAEDGGVRLPVLRLRVPSSCWRPDVLRVAFHLVSGFNPNRSGSR